jgi:hypothetical protein
MSGLMAISWGLWAGWSHSMFVCISFEFSLLLGGDFQRSCLLTSVSWWLDSVWCWEVIVTADVSSCSLGASSHKGLWREGWKPIYTSCPSIDSMWANDACCEWNRTNIYQKSSFPCALHVDILVPLVLVLLVLEPPSYAPFRQGRELWTRQGHLWKGSHESGLFGKEGLVLRFERQDGE